MRKRYGGEARSARAFRGARTPGGRANVILGVMGAASALLLAGWPCAAQEADAGSVVTPQHLATAYRDSVARALVRGAREARARQDTVIHSYDAIGYQRMSVGVRAGPGGRERILLRKETALATRWQRGMGAVVEAMAARAVYPGASADESNREMRNSIGDLTVLPYYPGQEPLWIENAVVQVGIEDEELIHPLGASAEAHYTYEAGDSVRLDLPDGSAVRLRELKIRPRRTGWNVIVGSLWFDVDRGHLARAVYRLTEPLDVFWHARDDVPAFLRLVASPKAEVTAIVVEYGLYEGQFWLRRLHSIEATIRSKSLGVRFTVEQSFRYSAVNAQVDRPLDLPEHLKALAALDSLPEPERSRLRDSTFAAIRGSRQALVDSLDGGAACEPGMTYTSVHSYRYAPGIPVYVTIPCDYQALATSPELPESIYSADEAVFEGTRRELAAAALGLGAQARGGARRPDLDFGLQLARFNRVEGLSLGLRATQQLGAGYAAEATLRIGIADREPNLELGLGRTNLRQSLRIGAYARLVAANHRGEPLGFGSSVSAFLWGRDEGFYYRATGLDVSGTRDHATHLAWRLFAEDQRTATAENSFSLAKLVSGVEFQANIAALGGRWFGGSVQASRTFGLDPRDWRASGDVVIETATGTTQYARAAFDVTLSRSLGPVASAAPLAALTLSAGFGVGDVPAQRRWLLGGTHTVRGHRAGAVSGEAFWLGRLELAQSVLRVGHVALFGDAGWAGPRSEFLDPPGFGRSDGTFPPRAITGAGVGLSLLDGLVRLDISRGVDPSTRWRTHLYLGARF